MSTCLTCGARGHGAYQCPQNTGIPLPPAYARPPAPATSPLATAAYVVLIVIGIPVAFLLLLVFR